MQFALTQEESWPWTDTASLSTNDIFTTEVDVLLALELTSPYGLRFLKQSVTQRFDRHVHLIQAKRL
jgi:hypothetical protein